MGLEDLLMLSAAILASGAQAGNSGSGIVVDRGENARESAVREAKRLWATVLRVESE